MSIMLRKNDLPKRQDHKRKVSITKFKNTVDLLVGQKAISNQDAERYINLFFCLYMESLMEKHVYNKFDKHLTNWMVEDD